MIKAIVTDIEGTTSSIAFVKEVLFPYARTHIRDFITQHQTDAAVKPLLDDACKIIGQPLAISELASQLELWIDTDQKITPLKSLQGLLWADGYQQGQLTGHVYPEVIPQLQAWHAQGIKLYVYSSGSVFAQKLLFGHTDHGDITNLFSDYFDTHIGGKQESSSYQNIVQTLGIPANEILFLSDITAELDAAKVAGMATYCLCRDGLPAAPIAHPIATNFNEITFT